jgi:hypothetical protein
MFMLTPTNFMYLFFAFILGHAAIFTQRLSESDGLPIGFGKASAGSVSYLGFSGLVYSFLWVMGNSFFVALSNALNKQ